MDIIEYVRTQPSFVQRPFSEVDSLVLCQLAYLNFPDYIGGSLSAVWTGCSTAPASVCPARLELNSALLQALTTSARFGGVRVLDQRSLFDETKMCQFSATLFDLGDVLYLAYRGTDGTLVGWTENLDLLYKDEVASQEQAEQCLKHYAETYARPMYVGGHSKGGVLALYAAAFCGADAQDRILTVYSHDGPGLRDDLTRTPGYQRIADRLDKTVPELSIFGMLFNYDRPFRVVTATGTGLYQHLPFNWIVNDDGTFAAGEGLTQSARIVRQIVDTMVASMSMEERYIFVSTVYYALKSADINTVDEIASIRTIGRVLSFNRTLPKETKQTLRRLFRQLISVSASTSADVSKQTRAANRKARQQRAARGETPADAPDEVPTLPPASDDGTDKK